MRRDDEKPPFRHAPVAAIAVLAWLALFPISDIDAYYHLATGHRILDEGRLPTRGVGSVTFAAAPWHDNEWGFQVLAALIGRAERDADGVFVLTRAGTVGLVLLRAACLAATLALLSAILARRGVAPLTRALAVTLAAFLTFNNLFWDVRPQIVSFALFAAVLWLLERDLGGARWAAPSILGVIALWANLHGAFVVGIALVGAEAVGELIAGLRDPAARRRGGRLLGVAAMAPVAACLNPWGYHQVLHPFLYVLQPEIHAGNADWAPPRYSRLPLLGLAVAAMLTCWAFRSRPRLSEVVRVGAFAALFSTANRHLPLFAFVVVPALATAVTAIARRRADRSWLDPASPAWGGRWRRLAVAAIFAAAIVGLSGAKFIGPWPRFEERVFIAMPERAVRFLASERVTANGFHAYRFGSLLLFRLYPQERAFIDGRNDLYRGFTREVVLPILGAAPGWQALWADVRARYGIEWVLVDESDGLAAALSRDPAWISGPSGAVIDGAPGRDGIVLFLLDNVENRRRLARWPGKP